MSTPSRPHAASSSSAATASSTPNAQAMKLGATGPHVFPLGLGAMGMSGMYGPTDDAESLATLERAIDRGVSLIDTGDFYGSGHNEILIGRAIRGRRDRVQLSVKFGALRTPAGGWTGVDNRPEAVKNWCAYSLKRLGVEVIDIYRPARLDPAVPIEDTVGAIAELVEAGHVRHIGLSEVGVDTVRRAAVVHPIADLQIEYSLASRAPEAAIFPTLRDLGISATLYGVLSRGLLAGRAPTGPSDFRAYLPRFTGDNRSRNDQLVASLRDLAAAQGLSAAQLALAWVRVKQPGFLPLVGVKTRAQLDEALAVLDHQLDPQAVAKLDALMAPSSFAGSRYAPEHMRNLDSER